MKHLFKLKTFTLAGCLVMAAMSLAGPNDRVWGKATFAADGVQKTLEIRALETTNKGAKGTVYYEDNKNGSFRGTVTHVNIFGQTAYVAARIDKASNNAWMGRWVFIKIIDGLQRTDSDTLWVGLADMDASVKGVIGMLNPADGPFTIANRDGNYTVSAQ